MIENLKAEIVSLFLWRKFYKIKLILYQGIKVNKGDKRDKGDKTKIKRLPKTQMFHFVNFAFSYLCNFILMNFHADREVNKYWLDVA